MKTLKILCCRLPVFVIVSCRRMSYVIVDRCTSTVGVCHGSSYCVVVVVGAVVVGVVGVVVAGFVVSSCRRPRSVVGENEVARLLVTDLFKHPPTTPLPQVQC